MLVSSRFRAVPLSLFPSLLLSSSSLVTSASFAAAIVVVGDVLIVVSIYYSSALLLLLILLFSCNRSYCNRYLWSSLLLLLLLSASFATDVAVFDNCYFDVVSWFGYNLKPALKLFVPFCDRG